MIKLLRFVPPVLSLFIAIVFIQSLFFKFTGSPETRHIFGTLDGWATEQFGLRGLFVPPGPFNAYVIGTVELVAAVLLLVGLLPGRRGLNVLGAGLALGVISGAIVFHLFTPLGIEVMGDGGLLFAMACGVWLAAVVLLVLGRERLFGLFRGAGGASARIASEGP